MLNKYEKRRAKTIEEKKFFFFENEILKFSIIDI